MKTSKDLNILLVEGEEAIGLLMQEELPEWGGHKVKFVASPEEAEKCLLAGGDPFDLVMINLRLLEKKIDAGMKVVDLVQKRFPETLLVLSDYYKPGNSMHSFCFHATCVITSDLAEFKELLEKLFPPKS